MLYLAVAVWVSKQEIALKVHVGSCLLTSVLVAFRQSVFPGYLKKILLWLLVGLFNPACGSLAFASNALKTDFPAPEAVFSDYIDKAKTYIATHQMMHRGDEAVLINQPFEILASPEVKYQGRFLFIHGLNDSPYVWHDMARSVAALGFDVRVILLPGSGTTPEAMLDVSYRDWISAARQHMNYWQESDVPQYLGGFSLGGVIATILALENPDTAGLLLVSPAFHSKLNHLLRWSWIYKYYRPWLFGGMIIEDNPAKYNSIPINSATQYYNTTRYLKNRWGGRKLDMPVLMIATSDDSVVDIGYMRKTYRKRFTADRRRFILYTNDTSIELGQTELHRRSAVPDSRIINQSHLSLINRPDNFLFGKDRRVLVCNGNEPRAFFGCMYATEHWYGAQHTPSPDGVAMARTTYNPDYDFLVTQFAEIFVAQ